MSGVGPFLSGLFFGGALDHVILALRGESRSPYGVEVGVRGNWALAALDAALALAAYRVSRRRAASGEPRTDRGSL